jgi:hypothetical protein
MSRKCWSRRHLAALVQRSVPVLRYLEKAVHPRCDIDDPNVREAHHQRAFDGGSAGVGGVDAGTAFADGDVETRVAVETLFKCLVIAG